MKLLVLVKQVPDTATPVKVGSDPRGIDVTGITRIVSPYDEFAVEEALRIKEKRGSSAPVEVVVVMSVAGSDGACAAIAARSPEASIARRSAAGAGKFLSVQPYGEARYAGKIASRGVGFRRIGGRAIPPCWPTPPTRDRFSSPLKVYALMEWAAGPRPRRGGWLRRGAGPG